MKKEQKERQKERVGASQINIAVTVTALPPTRLCRVAVFLVKPTFLSRKTGLMVARAAALRTNINIDGRPLPTQKVPRLLRPSAPSYKQSYSPSPLRALVSSRCSLCSQTHASLILCSSYQNSAAGAVVTTTLHCEFRPLV